MATKAIRKPTIQMAEVAAIVGRSTNGMTNGSQANQGPAVLNRATIQGQQTVQEVSREPVLQVAPEQWQGRRMIQKTA